VSAGALEGVRVLDLTRYVPGPYCTQLLGDLGAEVVKVEQPPLGDPTRVLPPLRQDSSAAHAALNRNKRSIAVDLRREQGALLVRRLAARSDVFVEGFRPGTLARRGLGAETLCAENAGLVYCSLSGYGQGGPLAPRAGHDVNYAALGGLLAGISDEAGRPVLPLAQVADMTGALAATIGILAALIGRERTGRGQVVDVSLLAGVLGLMTLPATRLLAGATEVDELAGTRPCYRAYRCADGRYVAVGALEPKFWEALCRALGRPELVGRQWDRGERRRQVADALEAVFATRERDAWTAELAGRDVCVEPVLDLAEALARPQAEASLLPEGEHVPFRTPAPPLGLSATPPRPRRRPPALGEHTDEVLAEAGYAPPEIERLRRDEVVA
jgi:crotonobetainyl-CoA:carnitine CoA-transferase CaiB-like acyl-CoA transferase